MLSWSNVMTGVKGGTSSGVVIVMLCFVRKAFASASEGGDVVVGVGEITTDWGPEAGVDGSEDSSFRFFLSFFSFFFAFEDSSASSDGSCEIPDSCFF